MPCIRSLLWSATFLKQFKCCLFVVITLLHNCVVNCKFLKQRSCCLFVYAIGQCSSIHLKQFGGFYTWLCRSKTCIKLPNCVGSLLFLNTHNVFHQFNYRSFVANFLNYMRKLDFEIVTTHVQLKSVVINRKHHCALGLDVVTSILELFKHIFLLFFKFLP